MRRRPKKFMVLGALFACWCAAPPTARSQDEKPVAARIHFTGTVAWCGQDAKLTVQSQGLPANCRALDVNKEQGKALYGGEAVKCLHGARLVLVLPSGDEIERSEQQTWYPIPKSAGVETSAMHSLNGWSSQGGISRGGANLLWPAQNSVVEAERFTVRWEPDLKDTVAVILRQAENSELLCCQPEVRVPGSQGSFSSKEMREALVRNRDEPGNHKLELILQTGESDVEGRAEFWVLTTRMSSDVQHQLTQWDGVKDVLLRHIATAGVYRGNHMYERAAEECDAAVAEAPESIQLLQDAISANTMAGRIARADALRAMLQAKNIVQQ